MIRLIVGKPRSGKSQYAVKLILDQVALNRKYQKKLDQGKELNEAKSEVIRKIYTDIEGINFEHEEFAPYLFPAPADWRDVDDGSVIFYDEVHFRQEYEDLNGKPSQNPMIKELTTHGHRNIDIYLITQTASRLERSIRGLIDSVYYVRRPLQKPSFCYIFILDKFYNEPAYAIRKKDLVHDSFMFKFNDRYQRLYKSASAHTSVKFTIQRKFIWAILAIIVMIGLSVKLLFSGGGADLVKKGIGKDEQTTPQQTQNAVNQPQQTQTQNNEQSASVDVPTSIDVEIKRLEQQISLMQKQQQLEQMRYAQKLKTLPTSVVMFNGKCQTYNVDGMPLDMSYNECKKYATRKKPLFVPQQQMIVATQADNVNVANNGAGF